MGQTVAKGVSLRQPHKFAPKQIAQRRTNLEFLSREAAAKTSLCVVSFRWRLHDRSQQTDRAREERGGLLFARLSSLQLLRRLIEPRLDT